MSGTSAPSISLTMVRVELSNPPGVSNWMISAFAPPAFARPMLSRMKSSTAGLIVPSMEIRSTCGAAASSVCATTGKVAAKSAIKQQSLTVFTAHLVDHLLDIFSDPLFVGRVAQRISGMECPHQLDAVISMPVAAQFRDRHFALQQRLNGKPAQSHDNFGTDEINLPF